MHVESDGDARNRKDDNNDMSRVNKQRSGIP